MARPTKSGIDYFPLDVSLDVKWELIEAEYGVAGFAVVVKLFQRIYGQGYYCEWTTEVALLFSKGVGLGGNVVSDIVSASIRRGIFNQDLYDKYGILTSAGIQKRYFEAASRRKEIEVDNRYLLVNPAHYVKNARIIAVNVNINSKNVDQNEQSKVKESKEEYISATVNAHARDEGFGRVISYYQDKVASLASSTMVPEVLSYLESMPADVMIAAIDRAVEENKRSWSYIKGVLSNWQRAGIRTIGDVDRERAEWKKRKSEQSRGRTGNGRNPPPQEKDYYEEF